MSPIVSSLSNTDGTPFANRPELAIQALSEAFQPFKYEPALDMTFNRWYKRYQDMFTVRTSIGFALLAELTIQEFNFHLWSACLFDLDIRTRLHNYLDGYVSYGKLETLVTKANRIINVKTNVTLGPSLARAPVAAAIIKKGNYNRNKHNNKARSSGSTPTPKPKFPCMRFGVLHFHRDCEYVNRRCAKCDQTGHKDGYCFIFVNNSPTKSSEMNRDKQCPLSG